MTLDLDLGKSQKLENGVPIAARAAGVEFSLDQSRRQFRVSDACWVGNIGMPSLNVYDLRTLDGGLQVCHIIRRRRLLEEHDDEMAWVILGAVMERIGGDDLRPQWLCGRDSQLVH